MCRFLAAVVATLVTVATTTSVRPETRVAAVQQVTPSAAHVLVIGVDGLGAEGLKAARVPNIRALMASGAHTMTARAVIPTVSSPNWASMIMGAGPDLHGVTSNDWQPDKHEIPPIVVGSGGVFPTMFGELRKRRPDAIIGVFHDWEGFGRLLERSAVDVLQHADGPVGTVEAAVAFLQTRRPNLTFVHLDHVDHAGHEQGWMSLAYMTAIEEADSLVGRLVTALDRSGWRSRTIIIISADHGGVGKKHGGLTKAEIEIPWIISGALVKRGHSLTRPVSTIDTAPTAMYALGQGGHAAWTGRPVFDAFISQ